MRIAVIGAGSVGRALAGAIARAGHDVVVGVRAPDDPKHATIDLPLAIPTEAAADAQVVILAVPAPTLPDVVPSLDLQPGTIVADATNAVGSPPPGGFATVGALVASLVPEGVAVVKAFDTIGAEHLATGTVDGTPAFLPIAGDPAGTPTVLALARELGFDAVDLGGPEAIAIVEDHARLWIHLMRTGWGRRFGFAVVGTPDRDDR